MLAGEDGPGGIAFDDFRRAYLVGSLALAAILFEGGLETERGMIRQALWPAVALATVGVAISAGLVGAAVLLFGGAVAGGAAARRGDGADRRGGGRRPAAPSRAAVPSRVIAALEVESGLNDPMSVFLTVGLVEVLTAPAG